MITRLIIIMIQAQNWEIGKETESSQCKIYKYVPLGFNHRDLEQIDIQFAVVL